MSTEETTTHIEDEEVGAPEHGLPGHLVRVIIIGLVLVCMLLSGFGNIATWTNGVEGVDYAIAFGTGIISEVIGAVLLVVIIWCLARPNLQRLLMALLFLPVWSMATFQNASASWSYYVEASNADEVAEAQKRALRQRQALKTQADLAQERIDEIKSELAFIGMTRTPEEIRSERDRLPENYVTKRASLTAELNKAERRISLDTELTQQRATLSQTAGAGVVASEAIEASPSAAKGAGPAPVLASEITDVWSFLQFVQTNRLGSLVMVMEVMKSFGLLLVNVVFSGSGREKRKNTQKRVVAAPVSSTRQEGAAKVPTSAAWEAHRSNANPATPSQQISAPKPHQDDASAKVIPMVAPEPSKPAPEPVPTVAAETVKPSTPASIKFADEEGVVSSKTNDFENDETDGMEPNGVVGGIGISSKFV